MVVGGMEGAPARDDTVEDGRVKWRAAVAEGGGEAQGRVFPEGCYPREVWPLEGEKGPRESTSC